MNTSARINSCLSDTPSTRCVTDAAAALLRHVKAAAHQVSQVRDISADMTVIQGATVMQRDPVNKKAGEILETAIEQLLQVSAQTQQQPRTTGLGTPKSMVNRAADTLKHSLSTGLPVPHLTPGG